MSNKIPFTSSLSCRLASNVFPDIKPIINSLSPTSSIQGVYTVVYLYGNNFGDKNSKIGTSVVNFGSTFTKLPVSFYSSQEISFVVPSNATKGTYEITVSNLHFPYYLTSNSITFTIK
jgi:hypothetical protein